jgi:uncharacterized protein (UPF0332 family)
MKDPAMLAALFEKSQSKLATARILYDAGQYDDSVSRAYYAVFHALSAILYRNDQVFSKHGHVIGAFNKEFVKTGIFPPEFSRQIDGLFKDRQAGDYLPGPAIAAEVALVHLHNAENIISAIINYSAT